MDPRLKQSSRWIGLALLALGTTPVMAHTVKVAQDVAVTIHIEPDDRPRAGEPAQAWFVLTQAGGNIVPLAACDCQLSVYLEGQSPEDPVLQPPLAAVSAERYEGIPGATIVFPQVGTYQLKLQGTPKTKDQFQPFEMQFPVTVATGTTAPPAAPSVPQPVTQAPTTARPSWWAGGLGTIVVGIVSWTLWQRRARRTP